MSAPQVFNGVTPEKYAILVAKAKSAGIELNGDSGTAARYGVEVTWNYSPAAQQLSIQCTKSPFFMSAADVDARIKNMVTESLA